MESYLQKGKDLTKSIKNKLVKSNNKIEKKSLLNKLPSLNSSNSKKNNALNNKRNNSANNKRNNSANNKRNIEQIKKVYPKHEKFGHVMTLPKNTPKTKKFKKPCDGNKTKKKVNRGYINKKNYGFLFHSLNKNLYFKIPDIFNCY